MAAFSISLLQMVYGLLAYAIIMFVLIIIARIDWRTRRIPNKLVIALAVVRFVVFVLDALWVGPVRASEVLVGSLLVSLVCTAALVALKFALEHVLHEDCLGWGDVKLVAAGCLFFTLDQAFAALFVSSIIGLGLALYFRFVKKDSTFPFGPALCAGIAVGLLV